MREAVVEGRPLIRPLGGLERKGSSFPGGPPVSILSPEISVETLSGSLPPPCPSQRTPVLRTSEKGVCRVSPISVVAAPGGRRIRTTRHVSSTPPPLPGGRGPFVDRPRCDGRPRLDRWRTVLGRGGGRRSDGKAGRKGESTRPSKPTHQRGALEGERSRTNGKRTCPPFFPFGWRWTTGQGFLERTRPILPKLLE